MFLIFKNSIPYLIAVYGSRLLYFIYGVAIARILGPKEYGLWSMFALVIAYGGFFYLGLCGAMVKEVSYYNGKGKLDIVNEIKNTAFSFLIVVSFVIAISMMIIYPFFAKHINNLFIIFPIIAVILMLKQMSSYLLNYFTAEKKFMAVSQLIILSSLMICFFAIFLALKFRIIGLLFGTLSGYLIILPLMIKKYKPIMEFRLNIKRLFSLIKIGFPMLIISLSFTVLLTIDRILIFKYLGKENLGYYGIVFGLTDSMLLFPASLGAIILPRLSEGYGATGDARELKKTIYKPALMVTCFMFIILSMAYLFLPNAINLILPQYIPGINAGRIALLGIMFLSIGFFSHIFLIAINRQIQCLCVILSAVALKIVLIYIFIARHMGIEGVAIAGNIANFVYSVFIILSAAYYSKERLGFFNYNLDTSESK